MKAEFYTSNRSGKWQPAIELDLTELLDEYFSSMSEYEMDDFIQEWMGHEKFLEVAEKYLKEAYAGTHVNTELANRREELLKALGDKTMSVMAAKFAEALRQKWYYEHQYWRLYHALQEFTNRPPEHQNWYSFFQTYSELHPAPEIGSQEWSLYADKMSKEALQILRDTVKE